MTSPRRALVIAAVDSDAADLDRVVDLPDADVVIAADGGADAARRLGRPIDILVGDLDSIGDPDLAALREAGVRVIDHPAEKNETDLELALATAVEQADHVHVVVGAAGRLDHALANLVVLASPRWATATVDATVGGHRVWVVRGRRALAGEIGDIVSLVPVGGPATGVTTQGLQYPLRDATLDPYAARGVSNVVTDASVAVMVDGGVLLAIRPLGP